MDKILFTQLVPIKIEQHGTHADLATHCFGEQDHKIYTKKDANCFVLINYTLHTGSSQYLIIVLDAYNVVELPNNRLELIKTYLDEAMDFELLNPDYFDPIDLSGDLLDGFMQQYSEVDHITGFFDFFQQVYDNELYGDITDIETQIAHSMHEYNRELSDILTYDFKSEIEALNAIKTHYHIR